MKNKEETRKEDELSGVLEFQMPFRKILSENGLNSWPAKLISDLASHSLSLLSEERQRVIALIDKYWKFDEHQQPRSSWHEKQDLLAILNQNKDNE